MAEPKILIVEDNRIIAEDLRICLQKLGFQVTAMATDAEEALAAVAQTSPDLVLMDVILEGPVDGIETAQQINTRFDLPVIYLTAYSEKDIYERAKTTAPFGYLLKPFNEHQLEIAIKTALYKHKLEKELSESRASFHNIVMKNIDGIVVLDRSKVVRFINPAAEALLECRAKDVWGSFFEFPFRIGDVQDVAHQTKDRQQRWIEIRATDSQWEGEGAYLLTLRDVSERKKLENMVITREKMASLGRVAAGIAHEVRNPLTGITVLLDAIQEQLQGVVAYQELTELIGEALTAAYKIEAVIKRVGDFAKAGPLQLIRMSINEAVKAAIQLSAASFRKAGIRLEEHLADDLPEVFIDCQLIEQILLNILVNAIEAMKNTDGERNARIETSADATHVAVQISDSGPGISNEIKNKVFDPFFTTKANGSGIGLSICQRVVTDHKGSISVADAVLGGAQFTIRIPKAAPPL